MAIITIIKEVKKIHPKEIALVKIGKFFHVYGKDSYIMSFLFGYKIKVIDNNCSTAYKSELPFTKPKSPLSSMNIFNRFILITCFSNFMKS